MKIQKPGLWIGVSLEEEPGLPSLQGFMGRRALLALKRGDIIINSVRLQCIKYRGVPIGFGHIIRTNEAGRFTIDTTSERHATLMEKLRSLLEQNKIRFRHLGVYIGMVDVPPPRPSTARPRGMSA